MFTNHESIKELEKSPGKLDKNKTLNTLREIQENLGKLF